jgi:hypothetical protein
MSGNELLRGVIRKTIEEATEAWFASAESEEWNTQGVMWDFITDRLVVAVREVLVVTLPRHISDRGDAR